MAVENLRAERAVSEIALVGDVMADVARSSSRALARSTRRAATACSRAATSSSPCTARERSTIPRGSSASSRCWPPCPAPVVLPLHPRTERRLARPACATASTAHVVAPPLGYLDFTALLVRARAVLTDSGGVQKEAYLAGVPCVTLRDTTEWVETVEAGWNVLVDLDADAAARALERPVPTARPQLYGDGRAGGAWWRRWSGS